MKKQSIYLVLFLALLLGQNNISKADSGNPMNVVANKEGLITRVSSASQTQEIIPESNEDSEEEEQVAEAPVIKEEKEIIVHTVKRGESLWVIAQKYLGDGNRWRELIDLNKKAYPSLEKNPNLIYTGWEIKVALDNTKKQEEDTTRITNTDTNTDTDTEIKTTDNSTDSKDVKETESSNWTTKEKISRLQDSLDAANRALHAQGKRIRDLNTNTINYMVNNGFLKQEDWMAMNPPVGYTYRINNAGKIELVDSRNVALTSEEIATLDNELMTRRSTNNSSDTNNSNRNSNNNSSNNNSNRNSNNNNSNRNSNNNSSNNNSNRNSNNNSSNNNSNRNSNNNSSNNNSNRNSNNNSSNNNSNRNSNNNNSNRTYNTTSNGVTIKVITPDGQERHMGLLDGPSAPQQNNNKNQNRNNNSNSEASKLGESIGNLFKAVSDAGKEIGESAKELGKAFSNTGKEIAEEAKRTGKEIGDEVKRTGEEVRKAGKEIGDEAKKAGKEIGDDFRKAGKDIKDGFEQVGEDFEDGFNRGKEGSSSSSRSSGSHGGGGRRR